MSLLLNLPQKDLKDTLHANNRISSRHGSEVWHGPKVDLVNKGLVLSLDGVPVQGTLGTAGWG